MIRGVQEVRRGEVLEPNHHFLAAKLHEELKLRIIKALKDV
jgi:hypothetical protein